MKPTSKTVCRRRKRSFTCCDEEVHDMDVSQPSSSVQRCASLLVLKHSNETSVILLLKKKTPSRSPLPFLFRCEDSADWHSSLNSVPGSVQQIKGRYTQARDGKTRKDGKIALQFFISIINLESRFRGSDASMWINISLHVMPGRRFTK